MTRFAIIAFALFTSACATDIDANIETTDDLRAAIEDIEMEEEQTGKVRSSPGVAQAIMQEYGPLAKQFDCDIVAVIAGFSPRSDAPLRGYLMDRGGKHQGLALAAIRWTSRTAGVLTGTTVKSTLNGFDYDIEGMVDTTVIEADFLARGNGKGATDYLLFGDWKKINRGGLLKGVIVSCN